MNGIFEHTCAHNRLNWARRTSWGRWDEITLLSRHRHRKFEPRRSDAEHATSWSRRLPTILNIYEWARKKYFVSLKLEGQSGARTRDLRHSKKAALTTAPRPPRRLSQIQFLLFWLKQIFSNSALVKRKENYKIRNIKIRLYHWSCYSKTTSSKKKSYASSPIPCYVYSMSIPFSVGVILGFSQLRQDKVSQFCILLFLILSRTLHLYTFIMSPDQRGPIWLATTRHDPLTW